MILYLFTKTCRKDFEFLFWAVASVLKRSNDPVDWTFVCDSGERGDLDVEIQRAREMVQGRFAYRIFEVNDFWQDASQLGDGYVIQQWVKMNANRVMNGDRGGYFLNWDSDVIATHPFSYSCFTNPQGLPIMYFTPFNHLILTDHGAENVHRARQDFIQKVCEEREAAFEYMRVMPIWMNGNILRVGSERGLWDRVMIAMRSRFDGMSEFNVIGWLSHRLFPDVYEWRNTQSGYKTWSGPLGCDKSFTHQGWSWGGMKEEIKKYAIQ